MTKQMTIVVTGALRVKTKVVFLRLPFIMKPISCSVPTTGMAQDNRGFVKIAFVSFAQKHTLWVLIRIAH